MTAETALGTIHVALAVYDPKGTYSQHAGVVMASIFENTRSFVCVHVLHDETLTEENREKFLLTAKPYAQSVVFENMSGYAEKFGPEVLALVDNAFSPGSLYRLFAPYVLPLDKVIYLDSDIIVNLDIKDLWEIPLDGHCLIGVQDRVLSEAFKKRFSFEGFRCRLNGCDPSSYVNSGVLVMNLGWMREHYDMVVECSHWLLQHKHTATLPDQDFLNAFFRGRIKLADARFNRCNPYHGDPSDSILHATNAKPWEGYQGTSIEPLYWKILSRTPWGGTCIDTLFSSLRRSPALHLHTAACYKKIFTRLRRDILRSPISLKLLKMLFAESLVRLGRTRKQRS